MLLSYLGYTNTKLIPIEIKYINSRSTICNSLSPGSVSLKIVLDEARNTFKKHVNALAIIKNQNNEKWLILKKKYMNNIGKENENTENKVPESTVPENIVEPETVTQPPYVPPPSLQLNQDFNIISSIIQDSTPHSLPVSPSPKTPVNLPFSESRESLTLSEETPPKIHPRRKSTEKIGMEKRSSIPNLNLGPRTSIPNQAEPEPNETLTSSRSESMLVENEQKISVKERKQMFNRMASESDVIKSQKLSFNSSVSTPHIYFFIYIHILYL